MAAQVALEILEPGADDERLDELTRSLREELAALDVDRVERAKGGPAPDGTRSMELAAVATLVVTLRESSALAGALVRAVKSWVGRGSSGTKSVRLTMGDKTVELTGASNDVTERLVQEFLRSVADH